VSDGITKYNSARYIFDICGAQFSRKNDFVIVVVVGHCDVVPLGDDVSFVEGAVLEGPTEP